MSAGTAVAKAIEFLVPIVKTWRSNELGKKLMRRFLPKFAARRAAKRAQRAARKAPRQRPLDEIDEPFFQHDEDRPMFPKHTVTFLGIAAVVVGFGLQLFGIATCTPDEVAAAVSSCVDPTAIDRVVNGVNEILIGGGSIVTGIGKVRAMKREAALAASPPK